MSRRLNEVNAPQWYDGHENGVHFHTATSHRMRTQLRNCEESIERRTKAHDRAGRLVRVLERGLAGPVELVPNVAAARTGRGSQLRVRYECVQAHQRLRMDSTSQPTLMPAENGDQCQASSEQGSTLIRTDKVGAEAVNEDGVPPALLCKVKGKQSAPICRCRERTEVRNEELQRDFDELEEDALDPAQAPICNCRAQSAQPMEHGS